MFPCLPYQFCVDGTALVTFDVRVCGGQPCVYNEGGAGIKPKRLGRSVGSMEGIEQGRCRHLIGMLGR